MKSQTLTLISITASLVLSLAATLASYYVISYPDQIIIGAEWMYRGWPLYWMIESWSFWSRPLYYHNFTFQPLNFLVDFVFYAIVLLIPTQIYIYSRKTRKSSVRNNADAH